MWAEKLIEFQQALEQFNSAKCDLCHAVKERSVTEAHREAHDKAKLKVIQLFNEQLSANQRHYESNKAS